MNLRTSEQKELWKKIIEIVREGDKELEEFCLSYHKENDDVFMAEFKIKEIEITLKWKPLWIELKKQLAENKKSL